MRTRAKAPRLKHTCVTRCPLPAGLLRLGAFWRQQSSLLHDPQQKLHDELVTLPPLGPATLVFFTLNIWPLRDDRRTTYVCVNVCACVCLWINGQLSIRRKLQECAHPTHTPLQLQGALQGPRGWRHCLLSKGDSSCCRRTTPPPPLQADG